MERSGFSCLHSAFESHLAEIRKGEGSINSLKWREDSEKEMHYVTSCHAPKGERFCRIRWLPRIYINVCNENKMNNFYWWSSKTATTLKAPLWPRDPMLWNSKVFKAEFFYNNICSSRQHQMSSIVVFRKKEKMSLFYMIWYLWYCCALNWAELLFYDTLSSSAQSVQFSTP